MREIKLTGLDESISVDEVREAIASNGLCKLEEINVGRIGRTRSGNGIVWAKCPKTSAVTLVEKKKIQIGWSRVIVELLPTRPLQCNKCWGVGHVRSKCRSNKDFTGQCFRCSEPGLSARTCKNKVKCKIYAERRMEDNHRMGSEACKAIKIPPSPRTNTETNVDSGPLKDTTSSLIDAAHMHSSPIISSPDNGERDANIVQESQKPSVRRADEPMEVTGQD